MVFSRQISEILVQRPHRCNQTMPTNNRKSIPVVIALTNTPPKKIGGGVTCTRNFGAATSAISTQSQPYKDSQARGLICVRLNPRGLPEGLPRRTPTLGRPASGKTGFGEGLASGRHKIHYECVRASICMYCSVRRTDWNFAGQYTVPIIYKAGPGYDIVAVAVHD